MRAAPLFILVLLLLSTGVYSQNDSRVIFLVRHAEKADDGTRNPSLNPEGKQRAQQLATLLAAADISAIYSTDYKRTLETGEVLAKSLGIEITKYDPGEANVIEAIASQTEGQNILVIGHSNTVPTMVNQLVGESLYKQLDEKEYDNLFMVSLNSSGPICTVLKF